MQPVDLARLEALVAPVLEREAVELVDLRYVQDGGRWVLRFFLDKAGGVSLSDCERMSGRLEAVLDMEEVIHDSYVLEVSSPGLDRVLKRPADFERFAGQRAKVRLRAPLGGQRKFKGRLKGLGPGGVLLDLGDRTVELPVDGIEEARLDPDVKP